MGSEERRGVVRTYRRVATRVAAGAAAALGLVTPVTAVLQPGAPQPAAAATNPTIVPDPCVNTGGVWVLESAVKCANGNLDLTTGKTTDLGLAYDTNALSVTNLTASFLMTLVNGGTHGTSPYGGDGITVGLYDASKPAPTGPGNVSGNGGGLGAAGLPVASAAFVDYQNPCAPSVPFVALTNGSYYGPSTNSDLCFGDLQFTQTSAPDTDVVTTNVPVSVTFDYPSSTISIVVNGKQVLSGKISLPQSAYIYLSGGSGPWSDIQSISNFSVSSVSAALSASSSSVQSVQSVPEANLPAGSVEDGASSNGAGNTASAYLHSVYLHSVQLHSVFLHSVQLHSVFLHSVQLHSVPAAAQALSGILLSQLTIAYPPGCSGTSCTGWTGVLAGTPLAIDPLQDTTLAQVMADPVASARFGSVPLDGLDVSNTPLGTVPFGAIALGSTPLAFIPLPGAGSTASSRLNAWCSQLASLGFNCQSQFGINPSVPSTAAQTSLMALSLAGVPIASLPLAPVQLHSVNLAGSPLGLETLGAVTLSATQLHSVLLHSVQLHSVPLGGVPLASIPNVGSVVDCTKVNCTSSSTQTLTDAATAGAILPSATLQSIGSLSSTYLHSVSLSSALLHSVELSSVLLHSVELSSTLLHSVQLHSVPLTTVPMGLIPLDSIPNVTSIVDCTKVDCTPGSTQTLADAANAGAISSTATLDQLENLDVVQLHSVLLHSVNLAGPLGQVLLYEIPDVSSVVDCTVIDCSVGAAHTLADAAAAGAVLSTATLDQLGDFLGTTIGQIAAAYGATSPTLGDLGSFLGTTISQLLAWLDPSTPPAISLTDILAGLMPPSSYPWQLADLSAMPLAASAINGGVVGIETYTTSLNVLGSSTTKPVPVDVGVTLPPGFAYVPGSAQIDGSSTADPSVSGQLLTFKPSVVPGSHAITLKAAAGDTVGTATATATAAAGLAVSTTSAAVNVFDANERATTPTALTSDSFNLGHISTAGDTGLWSITVPAGNELSLQLSNLPADFDLALFAPSGTSAPASSGAPLPPVTDAPPAIGTQPEPVPGTTSTAVQTAPAGYQTFAVSDNRGTDTENIQTPPLAAGTYLVQVSGYNGASSPAPYLLQSVLLPTGATTTCAPIAYPNAMPGAGTSDSIPANANTLFLVDTQHLTAAYGSAAETSVWNALGSLATDTGAGVSGARIAVDSVPSIASAYQTWNDGGGANPCNVANANAVVQAISNYVKGLRGQYPTIANLVIVGADDQIPFARIADGSTQSNERDYASSSFAGETNVLATTLSQGYFLSDDPFASQNPLQVGSTTLYTPQLAVGRLVETPAEITGAVNRFISSNGNLTSNTALSTGYSFLTSGAQAVAANLARVSGRQVASLINETWTKQDLNNALTASPSPALTSLNAHFDYSRSLPAIGNTTGDQSNLFTTSDVRNDSTSTDPFSGALLFSMGCHSGLDITDPEVAASGVPTPVDDWAKTFADEGALWVGNTGFGYGDTDSIAYSARLMVGFANALDGSMSVGAALANAKQLYAAGSTLLSPYDLKALMESTFYGLPMYNLSSTPPPPPPPPTPPTTSVDPRTGLVVFNLTANPGSGLTRVNGASGTSYYEFIGPNGTLVQTTEARPIEPLDTVDVTEPGASGALGQVAHGALVTSLSSSDVKGFAPTIGQPDEESGATAAPLDTSVDPFPNQLQRVATYQTLQGTTQVSHQQLDLVSGQFLPNLSTPGVGTQRLFNSIGAQVFYTSPTNTSFTPPSIASNGVSISGGTMTFTVSATDSSPVMEALVLYTDSQSPGTWTPLQLVQSGTTWSASAPSTPSGQVQYFVQVVDANGNVAAATNKGSDYYNPPVISTSSNPAPGAGNSVPPGTVVTIKATDPASPVATITTVLSGAQSGGPFTTNGGSATVTLTQPGQVTLNVTAYDSAGDATVQSVTYTVTQASQTVQFTSMPPSPATYGGSYTPTAIGGPSGNPVVFSIDPSTASGVCAISGSTVRFTHVGTCTVDATQAGDANYKSGSASQSFTIVPAPLSAAIVGSQVYGGGGQGFSVLGYSGLVNGDAPQIVTGTLSGCTTTVGNSSPVGNYTGTITGCTGLNAGPNYTLSYADGGFIVTQAPLTVTVTGTRQYGSSTSTFSASSYSGFVNGEGPSVLQGSLSGCTTSVPTTAHAGTYQGTISGCGGFSDPNYSIAYGDGGYTVTPAPLTATVTGSQTYGGGSKAFSVAGYSGLVNGDTGTAVKGTLSGCATTVAASAPVGSYSNTISGCSGLTDPDYTITYADGGFTVFKAPLTATVAGSQTYGGANKAFAVKSYSGFVNGDGPSVVSGTLSGCTTSVLSSSAAGSYANTITGCTGLSASNYTISYADGGYSVNPAPLTITASSPTITYGQAIPAIIASFSGFVNGDTSSSLTPGPTCSTTATSASQPGTYPTSCSGASDPNYTISYVNGTLTINKAPTKLTVQQASTSSSVATESWTMSATLTNAGTGAAISGQTITFSYTAGGSTTTCTATTNASGVATCTGSVTILSSDPSTYSASYAGNATYLSSSGSATITDNDSDDLNGP